MDNAQQDQSLSDYDAEWDREDAPANQGAVTDEIQPTDDEDTATSETAPETTEEGTPIEAQGDPAEGASEGDDGTDSTEDTEALRQAETKIMSLEGQLKAANDRLSIRGRELKELRQELATLRKAARPTTEFEKEFPQYAEDIRKLAGVEDETEVEETDPVDAQAATVDAILAAHPDAGALYNDPAFQEYLVANPLFVYEGSPMFVNTAINSDNAAEVIAALTYYKSTLNTPEPTPEPPKESLEDMVPPPTSSGKPSIPSSTVLTPREEYDAAWATDDD